MLYNKWVLWVLVGLCFWLGVTWTVWLKVIWGLTFGKYP